MRIPPMSRGDAHPSNVAGGCAFRVSSQGPRIALAGPAPTSNLRTRGADALGRATGLAERVRVLRVKAVPGPSWRLAVPSPRRLLACGEGAAVARRRGATSPSPCGTFPRAWRSEAQAGRRPRLALNWLPAGGGGLLLAKGKGNCLLAEGRGDCLLAGGRGDCLLAGGRGLPGGWGGTRGRGS